LHDQGHGDSAQPAAGKEHTLLSSDPRAVEPPDRLARAAHFHERYVTPEPIATTATHEVRRYRDARMARKVAMKVLATPCTEAQQRRFLREARIQAQLEHPAVIPVYDIDVTPEGRAYFTTQAVSGKTLRTVLDELAHGHAAFVRRFTRDRLLELFQQVCLAMDYLHERGVVHRNLTPENIVLGDFGEVYVTDFSRARVATDDSPLRVPDGAVSFTGAGAGTGTPGYAAPEQLAGIGRVTRSADVYSLGAILFELLAGEPLHPGDTGADRARSTHLGADARVSSRARQRDLPPALDAVCVQATALVPEERYASARALSEAIERFIGTQREIENRRRLAERHAENAESAAVRAIVGTLGSVEQRRVALREAGRALALDPSSAGARRAVATLLREPSHELPEEARRALEAEQVQESRFLGRFAFAAYAIFAGVVLSVVFSGVLSWVGFLLVLGPILWTLVLCRKLIRAERPAPRLVLAIYFSSLVAIAGVSGFYGPLVLVPQLAVASTQALNLGLLRDYRRPMLACALLAIAVPFALERLGVVPAAYEFLGSAVIIHPVVRQFPEVPVRLALLFTSLAAIVVPALYLWRVRDSLVALRTRLEIHGWQLRQLLPAAASTPAHGKEAPPA
jgi:eukaryotic-like serine/threonine-protein kinase